MIIIAIIILLFICFLLYGRKSVSSALSSDRIFINFDDSIHKNDEQQIRMQRALQEDLVFKKITDNKYGGTITGTSGNNYSVSLKFCSCPDFKKRRMPCKHMYKLIMETERAKIYSVGNILEIRKVTSNNMQENVSKKSNTNQIYNDNMNYMLFEGEGIFQKTNRKRKIHIEAFSEQEALDELKTSGYVPETIQIHRVPFTPPSSEQLSAMRKHNNKIPAKACLNDISFLIIKAIENQRDADEELMAFATNQKIKLSYYAGEQSLYNCIWNNFTLEQKFAFYLLCVEKDKKGKWFFNHFERFKDIAPSYIENDQFMNSFKRYSSTENSFYGFHKETMDKEGFSIYSESRKTNCYKIAASIIG